MSLYKKGLREAVQTVLDKIKMHERWAIDHPCQIDGVIENQSAAKVLRQGLEVNNTIQVCCTHGWVLPDRCRYNSRTGCDCGAYPPINLE